MNAEKIKQLRDLVFVCREVGDNTAELFEYLANLLESIDKAEPVAEITRNPSWDMFSNVNAVKRLPVGTKLYTHPPKQEQTVFDQLKTQMKNDADYAWQARAKHDEPVGVARTNAMLKQGDTFCVFELGSVPEGTKLYTHPPKQEQSPKVAPTVAIDERAEFEKWFNDVEMGDGTIAPPKNASDPRWDDYVMRHQAALGGFDEGLRVARAKLAQASTDAPQPAVCAGISNAEKIKEIRVAANFTCTTCGLSAKELLDEYADLLEAMGKAQQPASVPYWFTFPRQPNDGTGWTVDVKYIDYVRERCVEECRPSGEEVESVLLALELSRFGPQQPAKVTPETAVVPDEIETAYGLDEQSEYAKGWNDCRAEMLKGEK